MNNFKYIICFILIVMGFSCTKNSDIKLVKEPIRFTGFPLEENVNLVKMFEYKEAKGANKIFVKDSNLIIHNSGRGAAYFFHNYSLRTKQLSKGYLRLGKGPMESLGGSASGVRENTLWSYDGMLKRIYTIDLSNALDDDQKKFNVFPVKNRIEFLDFVDSMHYCANGHISSKFKVKKMDMGLDSLQAEFGEFVQLPENVPADGLKDMYISLIFAKPSGENVVQAYLNTDVIEIYNIKDHSCKAIQGPSNFDCIGNIVTSGKVSYFNRKKESRTAFTAGITTDKHIYLAYSGYEKEDRINANSAKQIFVYDWEGTPIKKLNLDTNIWGFGVSEDEKTLYAYDILTGYISSAQLIK